jgi:hypothetical protein
MVNLQTFEWNGKFSVYSMVNWHILQLFGIFNCRLVFFSFYHFGILYQEKYGNPATYHTMLDSTRPSTENHQIVFFSVLLQTLLRFPPFSLSGSIFY